MQQFGSTLWFLKEHIKVEMWKASAEKLIALYTTHLTTRTKTSQSSIYLTQHRTRPPEFNSTIYKSITWIFNAKIKICAAPTAYPTSSLETNLHCITAISLQPRHNRQHLIIKQHGIQHFQLIHLCWAQSGTERIAPIHTRVHSLTSW